MNSTIISFFLSFVDNKDEIYQQRNKNGYIKIEMKSLLIIKTGSNLKKNPPTH